MCSEANGFNLHAGLRCAAHERDKLERLVRYVARPAFTTLLNGIDAGAAYLNIHTSFAPGGEIRGFLAPVPEPATGGMLAGGLAVLGFVARRRKSA